MLFTATESGNEYLHNLPVEFFKITRRERREHRGTTRRKLPFAIYRRQTLRTKQKNGVSMSRWFFVYSTDTYTEALCIIDLFIKAVNKHGCIEAGI